MGNRYIIIGWLAKDSALWEFPLMEEGKRVAKELKKSPAWDPVWEGSLIDLITELEKEA